MCSLILGKVNKYPKDISFKIFLETFYEKSKR